MGLVHQLTEARDERRLLKLQAQLAAVKLLIIDELGYVPLSQTGAELLFEVFSQRHEHGSAIVTSNLPFEEWTSVFQSPRLTGALLDRLTHHVHIGLHAGTALTEAAANFLVNRRMSKSQQMRRTRRGAGLLLQVRCPVYNGAPGSGSGQRFEPSVALQPQLVLAA